MRRKSRAAREVQRLQHENDVLREMVGKLSSTLSERVLESEAENAKLRELVCDMYEMAYHEYPSAFEATFAGRMRELGVEAGQ